MTTEPKRSRKPHSDSGDTETPIVAALPWLPMDDAPKDRIIEGRLTEEDDVGIPIIWRNTRRRERNHWVDGGVWHDANTAGSVRLNPIGWREWAQAHYHIEPAEELPEEQAA